MKRFGPATIAFLTTILVIPGASFAEEPPTLLERVTEWRYPGSKINGATMSDAATVDSNGERTVPSIQCKAVLTTKDPMEKVIGYYKSKLKRGRKTDTDGEPKNQAVSNSGRSVTFHSDSKNRPLAIQMILVNTERTSTTLVISRAKTEEETHIAWSQYVAFLSHK